MKNKDIIIRGRVSGEVSAPVSKSEAHRLLICASLADAPTRVLTGGSNDDIEATAEALRALGAKIAAGDGVFSVIPVKEVKKGALIDAAESGSTLRFMIPVAAALGADASFTGRGRLPDRPLSPLYELMIEKGVVLSKKGSFPLVCRGKLDSDSFEIDGSVSSQFITGLMLAAPLTGRKVSIRVTGRCESRPYIDITAALMRKFGVSVKEYESNSFTIEGGYISPGTIRAGGDWSSAAFWITAGILSREGITVSGLDPDSAQGDKAIVKKLRQLGADIRIEGDLVIARGSSLSASVIECADIPDLVPIMAVAACFAEGETTFTNIARLRAKESDRVEAIIDLLSRFGAEARADENDLYIKGSPALRARALGELPAKSGNAQSGSVNGGASHGDHITADSFNDHRIAMSAAIFSLSAGIPCLITNPSCVSKSYPGFFDDLEALGGERRSEE